MTRPTPVDRMDPDKLRALGERMDGDYPVTILAEPVGGPIPKPTPLPDEPRRG